MGIFKDILDLFSNSSKQDAPSELNEETSKRFALKYNDLGKFLYEDDGFIFQFESGPVKIKWDSIERLRAYKIDLMTIDDIRMDIFYDNLQITISEDTPGWYQFVEKTKSFFPGIPKDWDHTIAFPAFATNLTILYEREDRIMPKENNFYASFNSISKIVIKKILENNDWTCHKASWTDFELNNSWSELILEGDAHSPLLNGRVAFHPNNITELDKIFGLPGCEYLYEFYDEQKNLILEKKNH